MVRGSSMYAVYVAACGVIKHGLPTRPSSFSQYCVEFTLFAPSGCYEFPMLQNYLADILGSSGGSLQLYVYLGKVGWLVMSCAGISKFEAFSESFHLSKWRQS